MCGKCAQCRKNRPFVHQPNFFEIGLVSVARGGAGWLIAYLDYKADDHDVDHGVGLVHHRLEDNLDNMFVDAIIRIFLSRKPYELTHYDVL